MKALKILSVVPLALMCALACGLLSLLGCGVELEIAGTYVLVARETTGQSVDLKKAKPGLPATEALFAEDLPEATVADVPDTVIRRAVAQWRGELVLESGGRGSSR